MILANYEANNDNAIKYQFSCFHYIANMPYQFSMKVFALFSASRAIAVVKGHTPHLSFALNLLSALLHGQGK